MQIVKNFLIIPSLTTNFLYALYNDVCSIFVCVWQLPARFKWAVLFDTGINYDRKRRHHYVNNNPYIRILMCHIPHKDNYEFTIATKNSHPVALCSNSKTCQNGHSKLDKIKVLKTNGSLMKVESVTECSFGAFCDTLTCIKRKSVLKSIFGLLF